MEIKTGDKYRHFKGGEYQVIAIAKDSENHEEMVVYQNMKEPEKIWVRPKEMFMDEVDRPEYNYKGPRFAPINNGN